MFIFILFIFLATFTFLTFTHCTSLMLWASINIIDHVLCLLSREAGNVSPANVYDMCHSHVQFVVCSISVRGVADFECYQNREYRCQFSQQIPANPSTTVKSQATAIYLASHYICFLA
jgi:hypothetical protein